MPIAVDESEEDILRDEAEKNGRGSAPMLGWVLIFTLIGIVGCLLVIYVPILIRHFR